MSFKSVLAPPSFAIMLMVHAYASDYTYKGVEQYEWWPSALYEAVMKSPTPKDKDNIFLATLKNWHPSHGLNQKNLQPLNGLFQGYEDFFESLSFIKIMKPASFEIETYENFMREQDFIDSSSHLEHERMSNSWSIEKILANNPPFSALFEWKFYYTYTILKSLMEERIKYLKAYQEDFDTVHDMGIVCVDNRCFLPQWTPERIWYDIAPVGFYFGPKRPVSPEFLKTHSQFASKIAQAALGRLPHTPAFSSLKAHVQDYHQLDKTNKELLVERSHALFNIADEAEHLLLSKEITEKLNPAQFYTLNLLKNNAKAKASYLMKLMATEKIERRRDSEKATLFKNMDKKHDKVIRSKVVQDIPVDLDPAKRSDVMEYKDYAKTSSKFAYFLWLEDKPTFSMTVDPRRLIPLKDMHVLFKNKIPYHKVFKDDEGKVLDGLYLYAIDERGQLYIHTGARSSVSSAPDLVKQQIEKIEQLAIDTYKIPFNDFNNRVIHSIILGGANALCAGEIQFKNNAIIMMNTNSGHYAPKPENLKYGVSSLIKKGAMFDENATLLDHQGKIIGSIKDISVSMNQRTLKKTVDYKH